MKSYTKPLIITAIIAVVAVVLFVTACTVDFASSDSARADIGPSPSRDADNRRYAIVR